MSCSGGCHAILGRAPAILWACSFQLSVQHNRTRNVACLRHFRSSKSPALSVMLHLKMSPESLVV